MAFVCLVQATDWQVTAAIPAVLPAEPVAPSVARVPCAPTLRVWGAPGATLGP